MVSEKVNTKRYIEFLQNITSAWRKFINNINYIKNTANEYEPKFPVFPVINQYVNDLIATGYNYIDIVDRYSIGIGYEFLLSFDEETGRLLNYYLIASEISLKYLAWAKCPDKYLGLTSTNHKFINKVIFTKSLNKYRFDKLFPVKYELPLSIIFETHKDIDSLFADSYITVQLSSYQISYFSTCENDGNLIYIDTHRFGYVNPCERNYYISGEHNTFDENKLCIACCHCIDNILIDSYNAVNIRLDKNNNQLVIDNKLFSTRENELIKSKTTHYDIYEFYKNSVSNGLSIIGDNHGKSYVRLAICHTFDIENCRFNRPDIAIDFSNSKDFDKYTLNPLINKILEDEFNNELTYIERMYHDISKSYNEYTVKYGIFID